MRLKRLSIKGLYGLDYNLEFNEDISLLYGLNGSGKTTILNILYHILHGELVKLLEYNFTSLSLDFISYEGERELIITKTASKVNIEFNGKKEVLNLGFSPNIINERKNLYDNELLESSVFEKFHNSTKTISNWNVQSPVLSDVFNEISTFSETLYIPINRKVKGIDKKYSTVKSKSYLIDVGRKNIEDSLLIAQNFFNGYINITSLKEREIINNDREKMLENISSPLDWEVINQVFRENIGDLLVANKEMLGESGIGDTSKLVKRYEETKNSFILDEETNNIKIKNPRGFVNHCFTAAQIIKILELSTITKESKEKIENAKIIKTLVMNSINDLFDETGKKIIYNDEERELRFILNNEIDRELKIEYLSSGEKQLLVFFIFSLINLNDIKSNKNKILLIDEPELSLHIEWQSKILSKLDVVSKHTQFIIATHSPDIIGDNYNKMVEVKGVKTR